MDKRYDKILGCLVSAAIGDAMGCPLETRPVYLIKKDFGHGDFVYDYMTPLDDSIAKGMPRAAVTDDFSLSYISALYFLRDKGKITKENSTEAILKWKNGDDTKIFYEKYGGPSTRKSIAKIEGTPYDKSRDYLFCENKTATNGAGMKAWIVGLFNQGNVDKAVDDALVMCHISHDNPIALSGGAAVAAAVAAAFCRNATIDSILEAGLYGARTGYDKALNIAKPSAGASVEKRMELAISIGRKYSGDFAGCITEMTDLIGTGLNANEAVPSAFGYVATDSSIMRTVYLAINSGNDCDTTAIMAASIVGSLRGASEIDNIDYHINTLQETNKWIDFRNMADMIYDSTC